MKQCPKCQCETFKAIIKKAAGIGINDDGSFVIKKESERFEVESFVCAKCNAELTINDFKTACVSCGGFFEAEQLTDGKCEMCLLKERYAAASPEDLLKVILDLQHKVTGAQTEKIEKKIAEATENADTSTNTAAEAPKRTRTRTKKTENADASANAEAATDTTPAPVQTPTPSTTPAPAQAPVNDLSAVFGTSASQQAPVQTTPAQVSVEPQQTVPQGSPFTAPKADLTTPDFIF